MLFPRGKTKFVRPDGSIDDQPGGGSVLLGMGDRAKYAIHNCELGIYSVPYFASRSQSTSKGVEDE